MKNKNIFHKVVFKYKYIRGLWTDSVALGVFFAFFISIVELSTPFIHHSASPTLFHYIPDWGIFCLGIILMSFIIYAIKSPRVGGLGATFGVCSQLIISAIYPLNIIGVIVWSAILFFAITSMINWYSVEKPEKTPIMETKNE